MAPYNPPSTHYSQFDVSQYIEDDIFKFIGKNGKKFYWLTRYLELSYMWYDKKRKVKTKILITLLVFNSHPDLFYMEYLTVKVVNLVKVNLFMFKIIKII